ARAFPRPATYGSSIYHVSPPIASSHQSVTLSEERVVHSVDHALERSHDQDHEHEPPSPYKFEYKVHDQKNSNYHERAESSDGKVVRGFYSLLEPHGEVRVVKYRADHGGFKSEVSRHGSSHGNTHGGGLGATIGSGPSHDLGSHGLGVSASAPVPAPVHVHIPAHTKTSIPIHEDNDEGGNQWAAIEDPKKGGIRTHGLEEIPAPSKEALGKPRLPEQILLQQHKKKPTFQPSKPSHHHKYLKRPPPSLHHGPRPGPPGGPRPLGPPHFHHRGPKRGPQVGPRPRNAVAGPPPLGPPPGLGTAPSPQLPQRREARPPPTPCKCSEQPPGHAAGHP
ncbi:proline-rich protein HaeIII subfamily 1-like, partial [Thrips palmi]|uniref:Proline-rich protein HaeIII subfamily 1-like n=1 Tax=Thrips palmi TaxID=161013 RepID=A0A6P8YAZ2_THRPL